MLFDMDIAGVDMLKNMYRFFLLNCLKSTAITTSRYISETPRRDTCYRRCREAVQAAG